MRGKLVDETEMLDLLKELFDANWAIVPANRREAQLHRRVARILVENGRIEKSWKKWLETHEVLGAAPARSGEE